MANVTEKHEEDHENPEELKALDQLAQLEELEELEEGGDPACWLHRLCPQCDAVQDEAHPARCWRCGAVLGGGAEAPDLP